MLYTLAKDVDAVNIDPDPTFIPNAVTFPQGVVQVAITGTATLTLQGRLSADAPWATVAVLTETGLTAVAVCPEMRIDATGLGEGSSYSAWLVAA